MKKILITGGAGFIASHTIKEAISRGYKVITNVRSNDYPGYLDELGVEVYQIDSRDQVGMYSLVEKVDGVINLAGILGTKHIGNPWMFYENNVQSVIYLIEACKEFNTPLVQIGVGNWFEHNNYSNSKYAAEREVLKSVKFEGLRANIVRGLNSYGERQKIKNTGKIIPTFVDNALNGRDLQVYGGRDNCGLMDMIYVGDLAKVLVGTLELTDKGEINGDVVEAGSGEVHTVWDIANIIVELTNSNSDVVEVPMRLGESKKSVVKAQAAALPIMVSLSEGLEKTINYYKNNHE